VSGAVIRAAGGVVWRRAGGGPDGDGVEVVVIHRPRYDDWSLPKGKLGSGEPEVEGAVREVLEETGFHVRVGRPLGETRYDKVVGTTSRPKVVRWWAMEAVAGAFSATREVDELRWVPLATAEQLLTRETDIELLHRFAHGPAPTRTLLVVRHARAGSRSQWRGDDRDRPLDDCGQAQADELVRLLARFDVERIWSADLARCTDTVAPFADALGLPIEGAAVLSEMAYPGREDEAVALVRSATTARDVVACSQGDVIPDLVGRLAAADQVDLPRPVASAKGSVWALTVSNDRLLDAEYFPPPQPADCRGTASDT
jgi:8-oxo-(d)GTP phosphatase